MKETEPAGNRVELKTGSTNLFWMQMLPQFIRTRLEGRPNLQRIITNTGWLFADRLVRIGVGLFVGVWVARYLGPDQFGLYSFALAFVGTFGCLASLGLDSIVVRDIVHTLEARDEILGTAFALKVMGGALTLVLALTIIPFVRPGDRLTVWLVGIVAAGNLLQAFDAIDFWFQSQVQSKFVVSARNAAFLIIALVKIVLIRMQAPLIAFAYAGTAEIALGAAGLIAAYRLNGHHLLRWRASLARARSLLASSWPLILSSLAIWVYMRIDQLMLGMMASDHAVGIYSAAVRLSEAWYFVPSVIVSSVFPAIVNAKRQDARLYSEHMQRLFSLMVALAYLIILPVTLLAKLLVSLLYGPEYAEASSLLVILMWAGLFVALGVAREAWTVTEGLMRFSFITTVIGAITNLGLNLLLIPHYGALAAAIATLAAQCTAVSLSTLLHPRTRPIFKMQLKALLLWGAVRL